MFVPCSFCGGSGSIGDLRWNQPIPPLGLKWINPVRNTCTTCYGTGQVYQCLPPPPAPPQWQSTYFPSPWNGFHVGHFQ